MLQRYGYLFAFTLPLIVVLGFYVGGIGFYFNVIFVFILIPIIDQLIGKKETRVTKEEQVSLNDDSYYTNLLIAWTVVQTIFLVWALLNYGNITNGWHKMGFILSVGLVTGGIGITVAHELGHKKSRKERFSALLLLMQVMYMHFYIEHNRGHHVWVGTEKDPATSKQNQSFYPFWLKSVFQGYFNAWKLEKERLKKQGKRAYSLSNQMIHFTILPFVSILMVTVIMKWVSGDWSSNYFSFFLGQAFVGFTLLELVNYIEHYGLKRKTIKNGKFEPVREFHSWNADYKLSNFFLFQLQLHSDHHMFAIKKYQSLQSLDKSPQMPAGYPSMILLAMIPPLWFRKMNPILDNWKKLNL